MLLSLCMHHDLEILELVKFDLLIRRKVLIQTSDLENGWSKALSPASVIDDFPYFVCLQNA